MGTVSDRRIITQEVGTHQIKLKLSYTNGDAVLLKACGIELISRCAKSIQRITNIYLSNGEGTIFLTKEEFYHATLVFDKAESIIYKDNSKKVGYPTHRQEFVISKLNKIAKNIAYLEIDILPAQLMKHTKVSHKLKKLPKKFFNQNGPTLYTASKIVCVLSKQELAQVKSNGNNLVIFLHGYNIPKGEPGKYITNLYAAPDHPHPLIFELTNYPRTVSLDMHDLEACYNKVKLEFPHCESLAVMQDSKIMQSSLEQDINNNAGDISGEYFSHSIGEGSYSWLAQMEYNLNRAAGFDGLNWQNYTRILGIHWHGDVGVPNFNHAQDNAKIIAKDDLSLIPILKQLQAHNIHVTIIAHSLGNALLMHTLEYFGKNKMFDLYLIEVFDAIELDLIQEYDPPILIKLKQQIFLYGKFNNKYKLTELNSNLLKIKTLQFNKLLTLVKTKRIDAAVYKDILLREAHSCDKLSNIKSPIDHAIMWQAAVQKTAFEQQHQYYYDQRTNDDYQFAHKGAEKISILYSKNDDILGYIFPYNQSIPYTPGEAISSQEKAKIKQIRKELKRTIAKGRINLALNSLPIFQGIHAKINQALRKKYESILENYYLDCYLEKAFGRVSMQVEHYTNINSNLEYSDVLIKNLPHPGYKPIMLVDNNDEHFHSTAEHASTAFGIFNKIRKDIFKRWHKFPGALGYDGLPDTEFTADWLADKIPNAAKLILKSQSELDGHSHMKNPSSELFNNIFCQYIININNLIPDIGTKVFGNYKKFISED